MIGWIFGVVNVAGDVKHKIRTIKLIAQSFLRDEVAARPIGAPKSLPFARAQSPDLLTPSPTISIVSMG